jgi:predicted nucleotidyltransferase
MSFGSILRGLTESKIAFVVVGGVAAAAHGATRLTNDIDVCYDATDPDNVNGLGKLLHRWKAYPRGVESGLPFIMDGKTLRGAPMMTLTSTEGDVDVMDRISGVGDYKSVRAHSEAISAFGVRFRIIDLPTLIKAKRAAGRPRDFEHLPELEALLALKRKTAK